MDGRLHVTRGVPQVATVLPARAAAELDRSGHALDGDTERFMGSRFGQDFSGVRVHSDSPAADSAQAVNAAAYTVGKQIIFGPGRYAPRTPEGMRLIAHELAHVVQQGRGGRPTGSGAEVRMEADAERAVFQFEHAQGPVQVGESGGAGLARQEAAPGSVPLPAEGARYPTDPQPWQGIQLLPVVKDSLPAKDTFVPLGSSISHGIYRLYPQLRNRDHPHVVYYIAYNTRSARAEFAIGPDMLDEFINKSRLYMIAAGNFFGLTGNVKPYDVSTARMIDRAFHGDWRGMFRAWGSSWVQALRDPDWWLQAGLTVSGSMAGKVEGTVEGKVAQGGAGRAAALPGAEPPTPTPPRLPPQRVLVVGAETEGEFAYARQAAGGGSEVTVANPRATTQSKAYVSQGGNFVQAKVEELPARPTFNVIREDFPEPLGRVFTPTAEFADARISRLAPGGRWTVITESSEFATTLEATAVGKNVAVSVREVPLFHEAVPASGYPRETRRIILIFEKTQ